MSDSTKAEEGEASEGEAEQEASSEASLPEAAPPESAETEPLAAPVKKRKKKKKKKPGAGAGESEAPTLDVSGAERAAFLAWFPSDPELDVLVRAFEVGNYALIRERADKLAETTKDEKVRTAARELRARIEPDPLMKVLLAAAVVLLVFLTLFAYRSHGH